MEKMKIMKNGRQVAERKEKLAKDIKWLAWRLQNAIEQHSLLTQEACDANKTLWAVNRDIERLKQESFKHLFYRRKKKKEIDTLLKDKRLQMIELGTLYDQKLEQVNDMLKEIDDLSEDIKLFVEEKRKQCDMINTDFVDFAKISDQLEHNAWYCSGDRTATIKCGDDKIKLQGYVYEPIYEDFTATTAIYLNDECLYGKESYSSAAYRKKEYDLGKFESLNDAIDFLEAKFDGCEVELMLQS